MVNGRERVEAVLSEGGAGRKANEDEAREGEPVEESQEAGIPAL